jgi:hypothetical protein
MSIQVKFRRGTATQHLSFTGANGEITVDTTNKTLRVHDGVTVGGIRIAKFSEAGGNTSSYLQVANAAALYTTKAYAAANSYVKSTLANTNSFIATKLNTTTFNSALANTNSYIASRASWSSLTSTNTALRTLISDRLQVANAAAVYQTKTVERAALANTNLRINLINTNLTGTNTALRTLISDRLQVANARSYMQVANVKSALANTNAYIATKVNTTTFNAALANTNAYINSVVVSGGATWSALSATNTALRTLISDRLQVANAAAVYQTKTVERAALANTNLRINLINTNLTGTNTALRTLISNRYQVANVNNNFLKRTGTAAQTVAPDVNFSANVSITGRLTVTGGITSYFANNVSTGDNMIYLNANSIVSNPDLGFAGNYNDGTYHHAGFFRDASDAGTFKVFENYGLEPDASPYIDTTHATFKLAPFSAQNIKVTRNLTVIANSSLGNTSISGFLKLNGTDIRATFAQNTYVKTTLANTNLRVDRINTNLTGTNTALRTLISDRLQTANASSTYQTKTIERAALANTNSYIATKASWTALTGTNTAIRTLVSDRYQVANVNTLLAAKATWAALTSTNTAIRALIGSGGSSNSFSRVVVGANTAIADSVLDTLTLVAGTGITIAANPATDTITFASTGGFSGGTVAGATTFSSGVTLSSTLTANGTAGTSGYYLRTSGTGVYWSPVSGGGGGSSNAFSRITVGANTAIADSVLDTLTLVAGSGITIAADPTTDTITFAATGGGGGSSNAFSRITVGANTAIADRVLDTLTLVAGSGMTIAADPATDTITFASTGGFSGGTVTGATTFTNATESGNNATGAVKITGGLGVGGNIYTDAKIGFANTSSVGVVYTYYNNTTKSLDTVFGI